MQLPKPILTILFTAVWCVHLCVSSPWMLCVFTSIHRHTYTYLQPNYAQMETIAGIGCLWEPCIMDVFRNKCIPCNVHMCILEHLRVRKERERERKRGRDERLTGVGACVGACQQRHSRVSTQASHILWQFGDQHSCDDCGGQGQSTQGQ
jgi:hypothetical protein